MAFSEDIMLAMAARSYLYCVFACVFGAEPSLERATLLDADLVEDSVRALEGNMSELARCRTFAEALGETDFDAIKGLYNALFVGPATPAAFPWEAFHVSNTGRLFGPVALEVRKCYRAQGLLPEGYPHVSDDALALELNFMAALAARIVKMGDVDGSWTDDLQASRSFIEDHLGRWTGRLSAKIVAYREDSFYSVAATALDEFVQYDLALLKEILRSNSIASAA